MKTNAGKFFKAGVVSWAAGLAMAISAAPGMAGCATTEDKPATSAELSELRTFYAVRAADEGHGIDRMIVNELDLIGLAATSGPAEARPAGVDGQITYTARWVDNDLFKLEIEVLPIGSGAKAVRAGSYLQRKQPSGMGHEPLEVLLPPRKVEALKNKQKRPKRAGASGVGKTLDRLRRREERRGFWRTERIW